MVEPRDGREALGWIDANGRSLRSWRRRSSSAGSALMGQQAATAARLAMAHRPAGDVCERGQLGRHVVLRRHAARLARDDRSRGAALPSRTAGARQLRPRSRSLPVSGRQPGRVRPVRGGLDRRRRGTAELHRVRRPTRWPGRDPGARSRRRLRGSRSGSDTRPSWLASQTGPQRISFASRPARRTSPSASTGSPSAPCHGRACRQTARSASDLART